MEAFVRTFGIWLFSLTVWSVLGGGDKFFVLLVTFGFFLSLPAFVILGAMYGVEKLLRKQKLNKVALLIGPVCTLGILYYFQNAKPSPGAGSGAMEPLFPLFMMVGCLWTISSLIVICRTKQVPTFLAK
jgi:hypothetical protein